jgi:hypothetical protein
MFIGFIPALGLVAGGAAGLYSQFAGRKSEKRARRYEGEAYNVGQRAGERGRRALAPGGGADIARNRFYQLEGVPSLERYAGMLRESAEATADYLRPEFERELTSSIGNVVGGLGRRGGMVGDVVNRAGERFTDVIAGKVGTDIGHITDLQSARAGRGLQMYGLESGLARQDEDVWLQILGELAGQEQSRANAARRGCAGMAGLGLGAASIYG